MKITEVLSMPSGNAIEVFNCSLCSYCETSLDRLTHHIRSHIKPEPHTKSKSESPIDKESIVTPRQYDTEVTTNSLTRSETTLSNSQVNGEGATMGYFARKQHKEMEETMEVDPTPTIEIINPRSISSDINKQDMDSEMLEKEERQQTSMTEKSPQIQQRQKQHPSQQQQKQKPLQRPAQSNGRYDGEFFQRDRRDGKYRNEMQHQVSRHENQQNRNPRFVPVQPPHNKGGRIYAYPAMNGNVPPPYMAAEYIPIAPAGKSPGNFHDMPPIPVEVDPYRRPIPHDRGKSAQNPIGLVSPSSQHNGLLAADNRHRQPREYFEAPPYPYPHAMRSQYDEMYQGRTPHQQQGQKLHPSSMSNQMNNSRNHRSSFRPSHQNEQISPDAKNTTNVQTRVSNIQYSNVKSQQTVNPIGVPNKGTIILNPDQLLAATGNESLDQLAGLLIVPLKKTVEMATQTDPVEFTNKKESSETTMSMSAQTDLKMTQISEEMLTRSPSSVFDSIRCTDNLFECLVCGEEVASDHHLQEHISTNHTHVCEKCYHTSTNLNEHNTHVLECGNLSAEMLCMECNSSFTSLKKFNQHRSKVHGVRMPFRCGICNVPFETHESVMKHISTHDTDAPEFKCRHCIKVFQTAEALSIHVPRHKTVEVLHECRFCKKSFSSNSLLQDHIGYLHVITEPKDKDHSTIQYADTVPRQAQGNMFNNTKKHPLCSHCDLAFKNRELLRRHTSICSKNPDAKASAFVCDVCKEYFATDNHRRLHLKQDHRRANGYRCPKCSKIYRTWSRLKFHTKQQHLKKTCSMCDSVFTKEHILRKHQEDVHGKPQGQPGERVYTCSLCNTMLNTLTELMNHRRDVHPELATKPIIEQPSSSANKFAEDIGIDNSVKELDDDDEFYNEMTMVDDLEKDDDEDELSVSKCTNCSEIFTSTKLLNEHMRAKHQSTEHNVVDDEKQYTCDICDMMFEDEKRLKNHKGLIHGEKPFECSICDKKFQYSSQVTWHMKNNHKTGNGKIPTVAKVMNRTAGVLKAKTSQQQNKPTYMCQFCGAKFKQEKLLKNHKGLIHKIKLFNCNMCDKKFGHSTELIWHVRSCRQKYQNANGFSARPSMATEQSDDSNSTSKTSMLNDDFAPTMTMTHSKYNDQLDDFSSPTSSKQQQKKASHLQLNSADAEELLKNEPQFDSALGEYSCPICQKTTRSVTGMKTHYGRCHGVWGKETSHRQHEGHEVTIFPCKDCTIEFKTFEELQTHSTNEHGITVTFEDVDIETRHEFEHVQVVMYTCPHCYISFDNSKAIRVHAFKKHGILLNDQELSTWRSEHDQQNSASAATNSNEQIRYKCRHCKAKFRNTKAIRIHTFKAHGYILSKKELNCCRQVVPNSACDEPVNRNKGRDLVEEPNPCDKCGRIFGNYRALFTHYRQAHRMMNVNFVPRKPSRTEITANNTFSSPEKQIDSKMSSPSMVTATGLTNEPTEASSMDVDGLTPSVKPLTPIEDVSETKVTSEIPSVQCPKCDRSFTAHKSLVTHLYAAHRISKEQYLDYWPDGVPELPRVSSNCPTCNKECVDTRAMRIHMYKAHGIHYRDLNLDGDSPMPKLNQSPPAVKKDPLPDKIHEATGLSYNVDVHGIPLCIICNKMFKGRRALMTHEHKFHGIRWVNLRRVFPERVRNLHKPTTDLSTAKLKHMGIKRPLHGFECMECHARYHNRRAITTHLSRIHRYRSEKIREYFRMHIKSTQSQSESDLPKDETAEPPKVDEETPLVTEQNTEVEDIIKDIENEISSDSHIDDMLKETTNTNDSQLLDMTTEDENNDIVHDDVIDDVEDDINLESTSTEQQSSDFLDTPLEGTEESSDDLMIDEKHTVEELPESAI